MDIQSTAGLAHTVQTIGIAALIFAACLYLPNLNKHAQLAKLPTFGTGKRSEYLKNGKNMYREGYEKFKDSVYRMTNDDGAQRIVVAPRFLPELRKLPDSVLNFPKAIEDTMETRYTKLLTDEPIVNHSIKADLTPALARLNPVVYAEVQQALEEEMPDCNDWTAVNIYSKLVNMVAKISGRIFVGPELCRDETYQRSAIDYTMEVIAAQRDIKATKPLLRWWLAPCLPSVRKLAEVRKNAEAFLKPIIQARMDAEANDPNWQKPDDMLSWITTRQAEYGDQSTKKLAQMQLGLIFAAIHTTTLTATNILYTLAVSTEYIEPLREEIRQVMADNGGTITTRALQQMIKLDSFMKETMRFYPPGFASMSRKVMRGFHFSNGQYIPAGASIEIPSHAVYQDPTNYPNGEPAHVFDGFRSYKLRQTGAATDHARNQFVTTNEQNLMFGYGKHACPGRFFAANEIKMILARLLLEFDFKNEDGSNVRYPNLDFGSASAPDASKNLLFKRVAI